MTPHEAAEGPRPFDQPPAPARYADRLLPVIEGLLRKDPPGG
ncbi:hypothetical protein [Streptosporangium sp. LJ11]